MVRNETVDINILKYGSYVDLIFIALENIFNV